MNFQSLPKRERIEKAMEALTLNGHRAFFAENGEDGKKKALSLIPEGAHIMNMTSKTIEAIGLDREILESGRYVSVRKEIELLDQKTNLRERRALGAAPEWVLGSVHAITEDGKLMIASQTGSQLSAYVYGALKVLWVVGAQKIVRDLDEGTKRIYEYSLPLESERARQAYGVPGSAVNKLLIINKEILQDRTHIILINQVLGF